MGKEAALVCIKDPDGSEDEAPLAIIISSEVYDLLNTDENGNQIE